MSERARSRLVNAGLLLAGTFVAVVIAEGVLRWRYAEPLRAPMPEVAAIQEYLKLEPRLGFRWRPNVAASDGVVFSYLDSEYEALSTDAEGFINAPEAIAERSAGSAIDVVGVGDSFVEHAAHTFHAVFGQAGLSYYNRAIHRQAPPQYTISLDEYGLPLKPRWVVYGLFENDFRESTDFVNWRESGLDWFAFHSGTWCGPPRAASRARRFVEHNLRGFQAAYYVVRQRLRGQRMTLSGPSDAEIMRVAEEVVKASVIAEDAGARLLVVLIPSRATALEGKTAESKAYDEVVALLKGVKCELLDLRPLFARHERPQSLYYAKDGHWNRAGMELAGEAIVKRVARGH